MSDDGFRLVGPYGVADVMPGWAPRFPQADAIVGYSDLGLAFLANSTSGDCFVLEPQLQLLQGFGTFADPAGFADAVLRTPAAADMLRVDHVATIRRRLGPLGPDQVYIATPYALLGGTEAPDTYDIGDVWVYLDIVAQVHAQL